MFYILGKCRQERKCLAEWSSRGELSESIPNKSGVPHLKGNQRKRFLELADYHRMMALNLWNQGPRPYIGL